MGHTKRLDWEAGIGILEDDVLRKPVKAPEEDRRKAPRISMNVPVSFRVSGKINGWSKIESKDISRYGIRLSSMSPSITVGTRIKLRIKLPNASQSFQVEGVVVWVKASSDGSETVECGISFEYPQRVSKLDKFLSFFADKLCSFALRNAGQFEARPVSSIQEMKLAYRLVYEQYLKRGYCQKNPSRMYYTHYCVLPKAQAFILKRDMKLLGTLSLIPDSDCGLPMEFTFPREVSAVRRKGDRKLAEVSLLALDLKAFEKRSFSLTDFEKLSASFKIFKAMFDYAYRVLKVTDLLICMHPKHQSLYQYLCFRSIGPVKPYSKASLQPALPMHLDILATLKNTPKDSPIYKYFLKDIMEVPEVESHFLTNKELVRNFLIDLQHIGTDIPEEHEEKLKQIYPEL